MKILRSLAVYLFLFDGFTVASALVCIHFFANLDLFSTK